MFEKFRNCLMILIGGIVLGVGMLGAVYLLPTEQMQEHVQETMDLLLEEGENPFLIEGYKGSSLDNYTDTIMLGNAVYTSDAPALWNAMKVPRANNGQDQPMESLSSYLKGQEEEVTFYTRYWHGYLLWLKPLLLLFNYHQIRILNMIGFAAISCGMLMALLARRMWRAMVAFVMSVVSIFPMTIPNSLQFSSVFYIGMIAGLFLIWKYERLEKKKNILYLFFLTGMATSFIDFLTYPVYTLGIPLVLWMVLDRNPVWEKMKRFACNGMAWGTGYIGMWIGKWLAGSIITGENLFQDALETVAVRLSHETTYEKIDMWLAGLRNLYIYYNVFGALLLGSLIIWILWGIFNCRKIIAGSSVWFLVALTCLPLGWYMVTVNHSYIHYWYTYRNLAVSVFAMAMIPEYLHLKKTHMETKSEER